MKSTKYHLFFLFVVSIVLSCNISKRHYLMNNNKFPVLDSLAYARLPEENYLLKGNSIFKKIIKNKDSIVPSLVEKLLDTTTTNLRIADSYNYKVADISLLILPYASSKKNDLRKILFKEFKNELQYKNEEYSLFEQIYYDLFFSNSNDINYKNRLRLHKIVKREMKNTFL